MPTNDNPATSDTTTDQLAAELRGSITDNPVYAALYRRGAERLAAAMRKRLPQITAAHTGALMIQLSSYVADSVRTSLENGSDADTAIKTATNTVGMAGVALYDAPCEWCAPGYSWNTRLDCTCTTDCGTDLCSSAKAAASADHTELVEQLRVFLTHFRKDDDTEIVNEVGDDRLTAGMLRAAAAGLERPQAERTALADEIEARYILDPADDEWDQAYNTAVRDVLRFIRGDRRPGLDRVRDAVRKARGGDAPPQIQGYA